MRVLIIEDEKPALEHLIECFNNMDDTVRIVASAGSVKESIKWLQENPVPDVILMDIQLSDGLSFNIFSSVKIECPVIFVTAYDKYLTQAFEFNSIDYLLKPIDEAKLAAAIKKYKALQNYFVNNYSSLFEYLNTQNKKKSRIIVRKGLEFQTIRIEDVAYFFTEHKIVFAVDKNNKKFLSENNTLTELEEELDNNLFFRANRKYIVNANYITRFKPVDKSKISVELQVPVNEEIIVSQENAASFKKWINEI
ncbi:MAG TPA: LytTR family DNA-binding domain-containing protein [Chitinophagaceae bacterium]|nr:LytTR family DNA-binding domain-containing protein [Chitinophagaceae bacterium]